MCIQGDRFTILIALHGFMSRRAWVMPQAERRDLHLRHKLYTTRTCRKW